MSAHTKSKTASEQAIHSAMDAVNMADLGFSCTEEIWAIFRAIHKISGDDEIVNALAKVGLDRAEAHYDMFGYESEKMNQKLADLKGGNHA